jgi:hypothetical protein
MTPDTPTTTKARRLYLTHGTKYKLELRDKHKTQTKGVWNAEKFCWMYNMGRKRIPVEMVRRVAVIDSTITDRSATYGWFHTIDVFLDKWDPRQRNIWVHPYAGGRPIQRRVPRV